ncbi:MAG: sodium-translocating pyrophosphatase [Thermoplasmata archaeon]
MIGQTLIMFSLIAALIALLFALLFTRRIMRADAGNEKMQKISNAIRKGAMVYLKRQYRAILYFMFVMIFVLTVLIGPLTTIAFVLGASLSAFAGYIGMNIATKANVRTTEAARQSLNKGLRIAFSSGTVMGLSVVGLGLLGLSLIYIFFSGILGDDLGTITTAIAGFGLGASSIALFARVGGGIFTKAADVGADLVGKVEAGIPEDDPRNPAVIADNVGDNVGDVAGMGADLYESYVGSIIATMALGYVAYRHGDLPVSAVILPVVIAGVGIFSSVIGTFFVRAGEKAEQRVLLQALRKGIYTSSVLVTILSFLAVYLVLGWENISVFGAILSGLVAGIIIGMSTEYFTSDSYRPTRDLAKSSITGAGPTIITGISVGMKSTLFPIITVGGAILLSYHFTGLYGIAISAVGMLSTLGITLATDAYGPVADNAGGIAEMAQLGENVRRRTDALDALGNTTAATGKGFAIGSAALTALGLTVAYTDAAGITDITLTDPAVIVGLFVGGMLPFIFCAMTMQAVGRAASQIVEEVRRQFREIPGLMEGTAEPDYTSCVDISTRTAQREMILPGLTAVIMPILVGLLLGPQALGGLLVGALVTGFLLAVMMANAGGAWDNAKKYIEAGHYGGKGSMPHKAAVVGDTVGDPFKDTSGPSLNILLKLMSIVSLVFASFIVQWTIAG